MTSVVMQPSGVVVDRLDVSAYEIPTDGPDGREADGTLVWDSTTIIVAEARGGGEVGLGYTYGDVAVAHFIDSKLRGAVEGQDALQVGALWRSQMDAMRNAGRSGVGAMALSAVDIALWDLRSRLLGAPLYRLVGGFHDRLPIYASGGFCNYSTDRLASQVSSWVERGISRGKIKTSRDPASDPARLSACRAAIGDRPALMTDANGALTRKQALYWAKRFHDEWGVSWLEEPVSSEDREGLRIVRDHGPPGLDVAAGEYGFVLRDFVDLIQEGAVDCMQADVTRCGGITALVQVGGLCAAHQIDLSAHCAPAVSAHAFCGVERLRHLEYFHDHVRIEHLLFDGVPSPANGALQPDPTRAGLGLTLKRQDAKPYQIWASTMHRPA